MALYDSIATAYDLIFPLKEAKVAYARALAQHSGGPVLDIGCATGSLALELARRGFLVTGIDLDEDMIGLADRRARDGGLSASFSAMDMRLVGECFGRGSFGTVLCLGNTVVHLPDAPAVQAFLTAAGGLLAHGGRLAVQLVSYEPVITGGVTGLPTIENEQVRFTRSYRFDAPRHRVLFATELTLKATGVVRRDETTLYPLTHAELTAMLPACGLGMEGCHADFSGRPFPPGGESFIAVLARTPTQGSSAGERSARGALAPGPGG